MKQLTLKLWAFVPWSYLFKLSAQPLPNYPSSPFFATKKRQKSILVLDSTVRPCKVVASVDGPVSGFGGLGDCWAPGVAGHTRLFTKHHALGSAKVAELQCLAFPIQQQILP